MKNCQIKTDAYQCPFCWAKWQHNMKGVARSQVVLMRRHFSVQSGLNSQLNRADERPLRTHLLKSQVNQISYHGNYNAIQVVRFEFLSK